MTDIKEEIFSWFQELREKICSVFLVLEEKYAMMHNNQTSLPNFSYKKWERPGGGGGEMGIMHGRVFEKVGVNISKVYGEMSPDLAAQIIDTGESRGFFATGVSVVAHMHSPFVPAVHFNTRYMEAGKSWFGGGTDLTPTYPDQEETKIFHKKLREMCDKHNKDYYPKFKQQCDEYFYLPHRKEARGVGGIFYDHLNTGDFEADFAFTKDVGRAFAEIYPPIVESKMYLPWGTEQRDFQLLRRGRYVEFNLLYDRGTKFGLMSGGNIEAILMSLPPEVRWS